MVPNVFRCKKQTTIRNSTFTRTLAGAVFLIAIGSQWGVTRPFVVKRRRQLTKLVYSFGWVAFLGSVPAASPNILLGLRTLLNASVLPFLEILGIAIFLYMGRSSVTAAKLFFHVVREKI